MRVFLQRLVKTLDYFYSRSGVLQKKVQAGLDEQRHRNREEIIRRGLSEIVERYLRHINQDGKPRKTLTVIKMYVKTL